MGLQDWVLVSSHVNGSVCNPLTAAIFVQKTWTSGGAPTPQGRVGVAVRHVEASLLGTQVQPQGTGGKGRQGGRQAEGVGGFSYER
jgi:hypothetical protein